jgi:hypothetical protein
LEASIEDPLQPSNCDPLEAAIGDLMEEAICDLIPPPDEDPLLPPLNEDLLPPSNGDTLEAAIGNLLRAAIRISSEEAIGDSVAPSDEVPPLTPSNEDPLPPSGPSDEEPISKRKLENRMARVRYREGKKKIRAQERSSRLPPPSWDAFESVTESSGEGGSDNEDNRNADGRSKARSRAIDRCHQFPDKQLEY